MCTHPRAHAIACVCVCVCMYVSIFSILFAFTLVSVVAVDMSSRSSKDSGIDACLHSPHSTPKLGTHKGKPPLKMTEVTIDDRGPQSHRASKIRTVSEVVPPLELPGTPEGGFSSEVISKTVNVVPRR